MSRRRADLLLISCLWAVAANACTASGAPVADVPLGRLLAGADAVVVATVTSSVSVETSISITLSVVRALKGDVAPGMSIAATWTPAASQLPAGGPPGGQTGIWFLGQSSGGWGVLPVATGAVPAGSTYIPAAPAGPPAGFAYAASAPPAAKLAWELGAAAQDPSNASALAWLLSSGAADDLGSSVLSPVWNQLSSSVAPAARATGLAGQVRTGSPAALAALARSDPTTFDPMSVSYLASAICRYTGGDAGGISSLGALARSTYGGRVPLCAAHALRSIHSGDAVRELVPLLDSPAQRLQYEAVAGIASFANGLPVATPANIRNMSFLAVPSSAMSASPDTMQNFPALGEFLRQPQVYISFWKNWLVTHPLE